MRNYLNRGQFRVTRDEAFEKVIQACADAPRHGQQGTWITHKMIEAYKTLFEKGIAHSYEVWQDNELVGGLYGLDLGHVFCGESMFSKVNNASKYALIHMCKELEEKNYSLIDCQLHTPHLESLGAELMPRKDYLDILKRKDQGRV